MESRCVLFCLARSGSTSLMRLLNCHPDVRFINEPFNENNFGGDFLRRATDLASLKATLNEMWATHNGIKHVWHPSGWPFKDRRLNKYMLRAPGQKVLFLNRRNILRRVVSSQISEQTKIWFLGGEGDRNKIRDFEFHSLDVAWLERQLGSERQAVAHQRSFLVKAHADFLDLWYEDLFESPRTGRTLDGLNKILAFLSKSALDGARLREAREVLDPSNTKMNSAETYEKIPGIEDIERRFGSDQTGWLFKEQICPWA